MENYDNIIIQRATEPILNQNQQYYKYPEKTFDYALRVLTPSAFKLWMVIAGQEDGFIGSPQLYCEISNVGLNNYQRCIKQMEKKGFIKVTSETIKILYPEE